MHKIISLNILTCHLSLIEKKSTDTTELIDSLVSYYKSDQYNYHIMELYNKFTEKQTFEDASSFLFKLFNSNIDFTNQFLQLEDDEMLEFALLCLRNENSHKKRLFHKLIVIYKEQDRDKNMLLKLLYEEFYLMNFDNPDLYTPNDSESFTIKDTDWSIVPIMPDGLCFLECIERMNKMDVGEQLLFKETLINEFRKYITKKSCILGLSDCHETHKFIKEGTYNWNTLYGEVFPGFVQTNKLYDFTILNENNSKLGYDCRYYLDSEAHLHSLNDILGFVTTKYVLLRHGCKGSEHYTLLYDKTK